MEQSTRSVLLIEDDPVVRAAVLGTLGRDGDSWDVHTAPTLAVARAELAKARFHCALLDLALPDGSGLTMLPALRSARVVTVVLSALADERTVYNALSIGAAGYLHKPEGIATVGASLREALEGGSPISPKIARWLVDDVRSRYQPTPPDEEPLTGREREMLELFARGATYAQVAQALGIGVNTVRSHVRNVYEKLQVCTKTEAVLKALGPR